MPGKAQDLRGGDQPRVDHALQPQGAVHGGKLRVHHLADDLLDPRLPGQHPGDDIGAIVSAGRDHRIGLLHLLLSEQIEVGGIILQNQGMGELPADLLAAGLVPLHQFYLERAAALLQEPGQLKTDPPAAEDGHPADPDLFMQKQPADILERPRPPQQVDTRTGLHDIFAAGNDKIFSLADPHSDAAGGKRQLVKRFSHNIRFRAGDKAEHHHPPLAEIFDFTGLGEVKHPRDLVSGASFRADHQVDTEMFPGKGGGIKGVIGAAHAGCGEGDAVAFGQHAGDNVDLVTLGHRDDHIGGLDPGPLQGRRTGAVILDHHHIEEVVDPASLLQILLNDHHVKIFF